MSCVNVNGVISSIACPLAASYLACFSAVIGGCVFFASGHSKGRKVLVVPRPIHLRWSDGSTSFPPHVIPIHRQVAKKVPEDTSRPGFWRAGPQTVRRLEALEPSALLEIHTGPRSMRYYQEVGETHLYVLPPYVGTYAEERTWRMKHQP